MARNTAAAIGAAAELLLLAWRGRAAVLPSDHWVSDSEAFWETVETGAPCSRNAIGLLTFGVPPAYPETGYGYIERGDRLDRVRRAWRVARFHEKPDAEQGRALPGGRMLLLEQRDLPLPRGDDRGRCCAGTSRRWRRFWTGCARTPPGHDGGRLAALLRESPSVSIDNGVLEKADDVAVVEARFAWSDLGTWISLGDHLDPDARQPRRGNVLAQRLRRLHPHFGGRRAPGRPRGEGLIVVRVGDATLVCPKERAQEVRRLVREGRAHEVFRRFF